MAQFELIVPIAIINFIAGFIGVILIYLGRTLDEKKLHWGLGFSAGILIAISILEIIPTAIELNSSSDIMVFTVFGFFAFFVLEQFMLIHHFDRHSDHGTQEYSISISTFIALLIHAFLDGVIIGLGFEFNEQFGIVIFLAIIFHRIPLAISLANIFLINRTRTTAMIKMTIFASMAPLGLFLAFFLFSGLNTNLLAILIATSGGMFIYIGATDMIPELSHARESNENKGLKNIINKWDSAFFVLLGMLSAILPHFFFE